MLFVRTVVHLFQLGSSFFFALTANDGVCAVYFMAHTHCYACAFFLIFILLTNKNIKIMKQLTEIEKQELEIHRVDNEGLIFETEFDGLLSICKVGDSVGFEVIREETIFLSKEQIKFLLEWLSE